MPPSEVMSAARRKWEIVVSEDIRVQALVSLIKGAHLTLFELLGYRYALSAGGRFVGRDILGEFFTQNRSLRKSEVFDNALAFFREFEHMVRPVESLTIDVAGTVTDRQLFVCTGSGGIAWALIVLIKTSAKLHAVMIPVFDELDAVPAFFKVSR